MRWFFMWDFSIAAYSNITRQPMDIHYHFVVHMHQMKSKKQYIQRNRPKRPHAENIAVLSHLPKLGIRFWRLPLAIYHHKDGWTDRYSGVASNLWEIIQACRLHRHDCGQEICWPPVRFKLAVTVLLFLLFCSSVSTPRRDMCVIWEPSSLAFESKRRKEWRKKDGSPNAWAVCTAWQDVRINTTLSLSNLDDINLFLNWDLREIQDASDGQT